VLDWPASALPVDPFCVILHAVVSITCLNINEVLPDPLASFILCAVKPVHRFCSFYYRFKHVKDFFVASFVNYLVILPVVLLVTDVEMK